jgi:hypothetical protein
VNHYAVQLLGVNYSDCPFRVLDVIVHV